MKHIKLFENFESVESNKPYAEGRIILDTIIVDSDKEFASNPLFYMWSEYPKYKHIIGGRLHAIYEFYVDKQGNKYFVTDAPDIFSDEELENLIKNHNWSIARNVDRFVENADKEDYEKWLDLVS